MHLKTIARNTAIRDAAISASEKTGIWQLALGLLAETADDTMQPDTKALESTVTLLVVAISLSSVHASTRQYIF